MMHPLLYKAAHIGGFLVTPIISPFLYSNFYATCLHQDGTLCVKVVQGISLST
jgi:hypothetical protein